MGNPVRFSFYLTGNTGTNQPRSVITRRLRLHRLAEVYVNMLNAGVVVYRDEKPAVFVANRFPLSCRSFEKPCFYASREVKRARDYLDSKSQVSEEEPIPLLS